MHKTLTLRANLTSALVTGVVAVITALIGWPQALWILIVGLMCGVVVGILQARAVSQAPGSFLSTKSALEVRAVLLSTDSGRLAVRLQWLSLVPLFLIWFLSGLTPVLAPLGAYAALMCARELVTMPALRKLEQLEVGQ